MTATLGLMDHYPPDVVGLAEHLGSRLGEVCGGAKLVTDRRGSRVYRLQLPTGDVALKLATHNAEEHGVRELAAVLHLAWTGLPPTAYIHDHAPWRDKLRDVAHGHHHDLAVIRPWPWPAFENALRHALTPEPENRIPSMAGFRDALSSGEHLESIT